MHRKIPFFSIMIACLIFSCHIVMAEDDFTDNGDGTVTNHKAKLMWSKTDNQGDINCNDANTWTKYSLAYAISTNYDNWRLPTLEELKSLYIGESKYKGYMSECGFGVKIVPEIKLSCISL